MTLMAIVSESSVSTSTLNWRPLKRGNRCQLAGVYIEGCPTMSCTQHLTITRFPTVLGEDHPFQKNVCFFFLVLPPRRRWSTQACDNELVSLYCTKCIFITVNKAGCGGNLIGGFYSKDKMHLSESNLVVYNGQQGPFVSLSHSSCEHHHDSWAKLQSLSTRRQLLNL